jgi:acid phosphatase family membrane protein YuiD
MIQDPIAMGALKIALTVLITDVIAMIIKFFTFYKKTGKYDYRMLATDGGMPSGHSATVSALTMAVFFETGLTPLFIAVFFFSLIVLRDATGVRRAAGRQAHVLNQLVARHGDIKFKKLKELIGHTPWQVFWGVWLGVLIAFIVYLGF